MINIFSKRPIEILKYGIEETMFATLNGSLHVSAPHVYIIKVLLIHTDSRRKHRLSLVETGINHLHTGCYDTNTAIRSDPPVHYQYPYGRFNEIKYHSVKFAQRTTTNQKALYELDF